MSAFLLQRVILPHEGRPERLYYHPHNPCPEEVCDPSVKSRRSMVLEAGTGANFKSYFNCFFEPYWRRHTRLGPLQLRLVTSGPARLRLWRWSAVTGETLLRTVDLKGDGRELNLQVSDSGGHFSEHGAIYFDLLARAGGATLHRGEWLAEGANPDRVGLVAGYCTFNREPFLLANLRALLDDPEVAERLLSVVVVDQGASRVREHPGWATLSPSQTARVRLLEQGNFGGAGGFTRAILEAQQTDGASHALLMDDDAILESESVLRTSSFLALARNDVAVGGQMLDGIVPTRVHEFSAQLRPEFLGVRPVIGNLNAADAAASLGALLRVQPTDYNAWWFFAFPLSALPRTGLPLPFFIHFDDVEFGLRLGEAGVPTVPLPGVGVWHQPHYLKARSWPHYYDDRNCLATLALHAEVPASALLKTLARLLVNRLLSLDYHWAWSLCEGMRDFRRGPEILDGTPQPIHQRLGAARKQLEAPSIPRSAGIPTVQPRSPARTFLGRKWDRFRDLLFQLRPSPDADSGPTFAVHPSEQPWVYLGRQDVVALDDPFTEGLIVLRRSRPLFLGLLARGMYEAIRLWWSHPRVVREWREGLPRLSSRDQWKKYLGIGAGDLLAEEQVTLPFERPLAAGETPGADDQRRHCA